MQIKKMWNFTDEGHPSDIGTPGYANKQEVKTYRCRTSFYVNGMQAISCRNFADDGHLF